MRHRVALLGTVTSIALAAAVATAAPAEARRNVGGLVPETCVAPGHAQIKTNGPGLGATCVCVIEDAGGTVTAGPNGKCPPGILRLQERP
jgi:hypothetical protein